MSESASSSGPADATQIEFIKGNVEPRRETKRLSVADGTGSMPFKKDLHRRVAILVYLFRSLRDKVWVMMIWMTGCHKSYQSIVTCSYGSVEPGARNRNGKRGMRGNSERATRL